jgi:hypothetical protein
MYVQVLFNEVSYERVCDYYNCHKPQEWKPLKRLERAEGGFCIDIDINKSPTDEHNIFASGPNAKIKQLRWFCKCLKTPNGWYGFSDNEILLLYDGMCKIYGEDQVMLQKS